MNPDTQESQLQRIEALTRQTLKAALAEDWQQARNLGQQRHQLLLALIPTLSKSRRVEFAARIASLQTLQQEIMEQALTSRRVIGKALAGLGKGKAALVAYDACR